MSEIYSLLKKAALHKEAFSIPVLPEFYSDSSPVGKLTGRDRAAKLQKEMARKSKLVRHWRKHVKPIPKQQATPVPEASAQPSQQSRQAAKPVSPSTTPKQPPKQTPKQVPRMPRIQGHKRGQRASAWLAKQTPGRTYKPKPEEAAEYKKLVSGLRKSNRSRVLQKKLDAIKGNTSADNKRRFRLVHKARLKGPVRLRRRVKPGATAPEQFIEYDKLEAKKRRKTRAPTHRPVRKRRKNQAPTHRPVRGRPRLVNRPPAGGTNSQARRQLDVSKMKRAPSRPPARPAPRSAHLSNSRAQQRRHGNRVVVNRRLAPRSAHLANRRGELVKHVRRLASGRAQQRRQVNMAARPAQPSNQAVVNRKLAPRSAHLSNSRAQQRRQVNRKLAPRSAHLANAFTAPTTNNPVRRDARSVGLLQRSPTWQSRRSGRVANSGRTQPAMAAPAPPPVPMGGQTGMPGMSNKGQSKGAPKPPAPPAPGATVSSAKPKKPPVRA